MARAGRGGPGLFLRPSRSARALGSACRSATASSSRTADRSATPATTGAARLSSSSCRSPRRRAHQMTDRLYYTDPYVRKFEATVRGVDRRDDRLIVALDRTAFYPTSGGQ